MTKSKRNSELEAKPNDVEETKGLLSREDDWDEVKSPGPDSGPKHKPYSRRQLITIATVLISLLLTGAITRHLLSSPPPPRRPSFCGQDLRSNGTHSFKRTVVIVSIDGLRATYLDRGLTPHLLDISKQGLRAKSMIPVFPTLTFPNHWALMTGLHAESHGIVANNFWDPVSESTFVYNRVESCSISRWWLGEPMWETAERAGVLTANLMWPGPNTTTSGASSTYFVPWKDKVALQTKLNQIVEWIDLPLEKRPQLIMAYEPSLDQAGHATGPMSARVNQTLGDVDKFAKNLHTELANRNLTDIVDIVFVSDHGMTDTSHPERIFLEDIIGDDGVKEIEHFDGWPAMGLRFNSTANVARHLESLLEASAETPDKFSVYTRETMPERYHFSHNERIAPIYVIPEIGYVLMTRAEEDMAMSKGNHGYDNREPSMHAMFVAHGPFSTEAKSIHQRRSTRAFVRDVDQGWHSTSDNTYIMPTFPNVEIYNLVIKLLGIENFAAATNGTAGFWDKYF